MHGILEIVPPTCDLTVPLLGVYQMAGYAMQCGFPFAVYDINLEFCKSIVDYAVNRVRQYREINDLNESELEECSIFAFISQFPQITDYDSLLRSFRECTDRATYWKLVDYLRACYDMYSLQFDDIRFRIDGFDSHYRWNVWADIEDFLCKYSNSCIMDSLNNALRQADICSYDTVGISITFESQLFFALLIGKALRRIKPDIEIVIGGGFINSFVDCKDAMGPIANYCNCVFSGEGEALIEFLRNGRISDIQENSFEAKFVTAADVCSLQLAVQPPFFSSVDLSEYLSPKRIIPLRLSYDCYWGKCQFCSDKEEHACLKKEYDIERMINFCVDAVKKNEVDGIYFLDSAIKPRDIKRFALTMVNSGASVSWGTNLRFEKAFNDDSLIELLARSGCVFAKFGLESGSQRVLDLMDKGIDVNMAADIILKFRRHGIFVHTYVMVGFPGETTDDREMTKNFLLSSVSHPDNYNCSEFILYGNAKIAKNYAHMLKEKEQEVDGWYSYQYESFTNNSIRSFVAEMRKSFDDAFRPVSVLMSTGHTIAYAKLFHVQDHTDSSNKGITLSGKVFRVKINGTPALLWWKRNEGCRYILGEWAEYLYGILKDGISHNDYLLLNLPQEINEILWNDACLQDCNVWDSGRLLSDFPVTTPVIRNSRHFDLDWYGQYDVS